MICLGIFKTKVENHLLLVFFYTNETLITINYTIYYSGSFAKHAHLYFSSNNEFIKIMIFGIIKYTQRQFFQILEFFLLFKAIKVFVFLMNRKLFSG